MSEFCNENLKKYYLECHGYHAFLFKKYGFIAVTENCFIVDDIILYEKVLSECEKYVLNGIDIVKRYGEEDGDTEAEIAENIILSVFTEFVHEQKVKELTIKCKNILQTQHDILISSNKKNERTKLAIDESEKILKNMNNLEIKFSLNE